MHRHLVSRIGLSFFSVLVTAVALEVVFRVFDKSCPEPDPTQAIDRSLFHYRAGQTRLHPWVNGETNAVRVAVIGDSFTLGAGVQFDDAYPMRLERLLNLCDGARPVEVRVYGAAGTSTYQQLANLAEALQSDPSIVILGICPNDTEDWTQRDQILSWRHDMDFHQPRGMLRAMTTRSHVFGFAYLKLEHLLAVRGYRAYYRHIYDPEYSGWQRFAKSLPLFQAQCRDHGCNFAALVFPLLSEPFDQGRYPFEPMHRQVLDALGANQIPYVDLLEVLRGKNEFRMQAIPNLDPHPSEIAQRIAAEAVFWNLLEWHWFDQTYAPTGSYAQHTLWEKKIAQRRIPSHS